MGDKINVDSLRPSTNFLDNLNKLTSLKTIKWFKKICRFINWFSSFYLYLRKNTEQLTDKLKNNKKLFWDETDNIVLNNIKKLIKK